MQNPTPELYYFEVPASDLDRTNFGTCVMRRLRRRDELEASRWAFEFATKDERENIFAMMEREQAEKVKLAVVAINGQEVNHPLLAADEWWSRSWDYLRSWYGEVNGGDPEAVKKSRGTRITSLSEMPKIGDGDAGGEADSEMSPASSHGSTGIRVA